MNDSMIKTTFFANGYSVAIFADDITALAVYLNNLIYTTIGVNLRCPSCDVPLTASKAVIRHSTLKERFICPDCNCHITYCREVTTDEMVIGSFSGFAPSEVSIEIDINDVREVDTK